MGEKMDRGTDALKAHLNGTTNMSIRQTRLGFCQEILGCEARTEFKYFIGENQVASSLEDANCCCRLWLSPCHSFKMPIKEMNTEAELMTVDRPCTCPVGSCKCCCYQMATFTSGSDKLGSIKEDCFFCVPAFTVSDASGKELYIVHPPTCCGGMLMNCCTEGNPCCGKGCCKVPFHVFPASMKGSTDGDAAYIGKIVKKPKSLATEIFTEANAFDVTFPTDASAGEKGMLMGTAIFLNANFFEGGNNN